MYIIYALVDPRDNSVRYVGITDDVYKRFVQHIQCSGNNYVKNAWVHELRAANKMVIMETLEEVEKRDEALLKEQYWIQHFQMLREPIVNINKTSSARKAKRTNLRISRKIAQDIMHDVPSTIISKPIVPVPAERFINPSGWLLKEAMKHVAHGIASNAALQEALSQIANLDTIDDLFSEIGKMKAKGCSNADILKHYELHPAGRNNTNLGALIEIASEVTSDTAE